MVKGLSFFPLCPLSPLFTADGTLPSGKVVTGNGLAVFGRWREMRWQSRAVNPHMDPQMLANSEQHRRSVSHQRDDSPSVQNGTPIPPQSLSAKKSQSIEPIQAKPVMNGIVKAEEEVVDPTVYTPFTRT